MNKKIILGVLFLLSFSLITVSCSDDDDDMPTKPVLQLKELGSGHDSPTDKTAYIGSNVHISAEIIADGLIDKIEVTIEQKDGNYTIGKVYTDTKYAGNKNTHFHEHVDIPSDTPIGNYHFCLIVTDKFGQTAKEETTLTIKEHHHAE
jgi:hypothetical protein